MCRPACTTHDKLFDRELRHINHVIQNFLQAGVGRRVREPFRQEDPLIIAPDLRLE
jgi:hypothetical protein